MEFKTRTRSCTRALKERVIPRGKMRRGQELCANLSALDKSRQDSKAALDNRGERPMDPHDTFTHLSIKPKYQFYCAIKYIKSSERIRVEYQWKA